MTTETIKTKRGEIYIQSMKGYRHDREILVNGVVDMRINGASTKTILDFLRDEYGYAQTASYEILQEAQEKIKEIYADKHEVAFEEAKSRLERLYESTDDKKLKLQIQAELSKLMGLHRPTKVDVQHSGSINMNLIIKDEQQKKDIEDNL